MTDAGICTICGCLTALRTVYPTSNYVTVMINPTRIIVCNDCQSKEDDPVNGEKCFEEDK